MIFPATTKERMESPESQTEPQPETPVVESEDAVESSPEEEVVESVEANVEDPVVVEDPIQAEIQPATPVVPEQDETTTPDAAPQPEIQTPVTSPAPINPPLVLPVEPVSIVSSQTSTASGQDNVEQSTCCQVEKVPDPIENVEERIAGYLETKSRCEAKYDECKSRYVDEYYLAKASIHKQGLKKKEKKKAKKKAKKEYKKKKERVDDALKKVRKDRKIELGLK